MRNFIVFALILSLALSLCACRMGESNETTPPTEVTTVPDTTAAPTEPPETTPIVTIPIPTIEPNVPDPSVDDDHLIDPTEESQTNDESALNEFF